jgi:trehalose 6-phosphate synthase
VRDGNTDYATLPLSRKDYDNYYLGYSNEVLWPVFHFNLGAMDFQRVFLQAYQRVNALFADALTPLLEGDETVWIHDYHLIPLGRELRERGANQSMGFYLHIPFPSYDLIRAMPGFRGLLHDLCQYDLIGFQTENDRSAFEESVVQAMNGVLEQPGVLRFGARHLRTGVYPVGVDVEEIGDLALQSARTPRVRRLVQGLGDRDLVVGVDRLDYSKGLPNRFRAYEAALRNYPELRGRTVFMQIASPSRSAIPEYKTLRRQLEGLCGHINGTYADLDWVPMHYLHRTFSRDSLMGLYRSAHAALVTPLRDGMNLVAKEFVAAQDPEDPGVLVLSELAGAAHELTGAIQVNPYDVDAIAMALHEAIQMPLDERRRRYESMYETLTNNSILQWRRRYLSDLAESRCATGLGK